MTDLRQAAQQALEALIDAANVLSAPMFADAVDALKAAMAEQPAQPAQPAQRTWVALTDEEISDCDPSEEGVLGLFEIARKLEEKLKERNT